MKELICQCPGCGLRLPDQRLGISDRFHASGECWELYGELSVYTLTRGHTTFIHQLAVDAYGAQHAGGNTKPITTVFSLVGLCLANEHGFTGREVQLAHMKLAKPSTQWPRIELPIQAYDMTVQDVLLAEEGDLRDEMIRAWSASVWQNWAFKHDWVRNICKPLL